MGCIFSHVQVLFSKSEDQKETSMFSRKSRSREVLLQSQTSTIITPAKQRGGGSSKVPYSSLEEPSGEITLEDAVSRRDKELLQRLILTGAFQPAPFDIHEKKKNNPVELACKLGFTDIVEVFLDNGCSPNLPTSQGRLIHSVLEGMKCESISLESGRRLIQLLCDSGCDVNINDARYTSTLMYASELGDTVVLDIILRHCSTSQLSYQCGGSSYTPLHMSTMRGDSECVRQLLKFSPSKHVNIRDHYGNTSLVLSLKTMENNLKYLNSARRDMDSDNNAKRWLKEKEKLLRFQHCSVSIVESLLLAGADANMNCRDGLGSPLPHALYLCRLDETNGFQDESVSHGHEFTNTMHLVSTEKIQNLERISTDANHEPQEFSVVGQETFSLYAGVVRLLMLSGAEINTPKETLFSRYPSLTPLLEEIFEFWTRYQHTKPPKLMHLAKQTVRNHLASLQKLHELDKLPLPERLKNYVKLNCL
ncbi:E3 ubiquitin-protein ligase MIB2-like [Haliotis cracherodii]|uniref:E3 ubiquitin-protein ligase MIB2-like n=1 Tax=Haliotis cracherodii TaxID=6455 RepID=UPI0039ED0051